MYKWPSDIFIIQWFPVDDLSISSNIGVQFFSLYVTIRYATNETEKSLQNAFQKFYFSLT